MVCFLVILQGTFRIQTQIKLVFPAELVAGFTQGIVPDLRTRMAFGKIRSMCSYFISDHSYTDIFFLRQSEMFFRGYIAKHCCSVPTDLCCADGTCDMVVSRRNIRYQRAEGIKWCSVAFFYLPVHILSDLMHRHMTGTFDKCLYILCPGTFYEFTHCVQLRKLSPVIGITNRSGT